MVGVGIDKVVLPDIGIGRVHMPDQHAGTSQVLVPLDTLTVLDDEVFAIGGGVQAVTRVALFERRYGNGALALNQGGLCKAQSIALEQAVASRVAAIVVLKAASHDRPCHRILSVYTAATVTVRIIEVWQAQAMAELMANGTDASHIVIIDIILIFFTCHIC